MQLRPQAKAATCQAFIHSFIQWCRSRILPRRIIPFLQWIKREEWIGQWVGLLRQLPTDGGISWDSSISSTPAPVEADLVSMLTEWWSLEWGGKSKWFYQYEQRMDSDTEQLKTEHLPFATTGQNDTDSIGSLWQGGLNFYSTQSYIYTVLYTFIQKNPQVIYRLGGDCGLPNLKLYKSTRIVCGVHTLPPAAVCLTLQGERFQVITRDKGSSWFCFKNVTVD